MTLTQIKRQEMDAQVSEQPTVELRVLIKLGGDRNFIREASHKVPFIGRGVKIVSPFWPQNNHKVLFLTSEPLG